MPKVLVLMGDSRTPAVQMFQRHGYEVTNHWKEAELICFLGGTDVAPELYGAERHPMTQSPDLARDEREIAIFNEYKDIPKVGICRGGQLLNVLNGGQMIQHLSHQYSGDEPMGVDKEKVRVDHHQGMIAGPNAVDVTGYMSTLGHNDEHDSIMVWGYYPETKSLCFQPHPEWGHKGTEDYFFELLEEHFGF